MPNDSDVCERLVICTDDEDDWKEFLKMCAKSFQNSAPFKRSHPDFEKRKKFVKAYFAYLYETELSRGRAGLACVKRLAGSKKEEIVYGLVGIYHGSEMSAGDKTRMMSINRNGTDIALKEDEWIHENFRNKMTEASTTFGFAWINYVLQVSKYRNHGLATKYFRNAGEMVGHDGIRRQKIPRGVRVVAYAVLDDYALKDFYVKVGMIELAHRHSNSDGAQRCKEDFSDDKSTCGCDCLYLMYTGYPEWDCFEEPLKRWFRSNQNSADHGFIASSH